MKKKVKFLQSIASETFAYRPGEEAVIDARLADAWCMSGVCAMVADTKPELKK